MISGIFIESQPSFVINIPQAQFVHITAYDLDHLRYNKSKLEFRGYNFEQNHYLLSSKQVDDHSQYLLTRPGIYQATSGNNPNQIVQV